MGQKKLSKSEIEYFLFLIFKVEFQMLGIKLF